jgi:hypothetical protein
MRRIIGAQHGRWMVCDEHVCRSLRWKFLTAIALNPNRGTEQRLRGRAAEADERYGPDAIDLRFEPGATGPNIGHTRALVDTPLALTPERKVFDGIGLGYCRCFCLAGVWRRSVGFGSPVGHEHQRSKRNACHYALVEKPL